MIVSKGLRGFVLERDSYTCQKCGLTSTSGEGLEIDHKQSIFEGGNNKLSNLWALCRKCNRLKWKTSLSGVELEQSKIKTYREKKGLTIKQLALAAKISINTARRLEASGKVTNFVLKNVADILEVPINELEEFRYHHSAITHYD